MHTHVQEPLKIDENTLKEQIDLKFEEYKTDIQNLVKKMIKGKADMAELDKLEEVYHLEMDEYVKSFKVKYIEKEEVKRALKGMDRAI